ncbi:MAG TPA: S8 family serine peptidase [Candidatus Kryptonia bacterium]
MRLRLLSRAAFVVFAVLIASACMCARALANAHGGNRASAPQERTTTINPAKLALPGVVVVKFKPGVQQSLQDLYNVPELPGRILKEADLASMKPMLQMLRIKLDKSSALLNNIYIIHYSGSITPAFLSQSLMKNPDILYAEPHYIYKINDVTFTPNDSLLSDQYALPLIQAFQAWDVTQGDTSVAIGIVDTGVDWMHPDLYANIWHNWKDINSGWSGDADGFVADSIGWDFGGSSGAPDNNPMEDAPYHGTHVAGIAAAVSNNSIGIAGVAPHCKIMAVKVAEGDQVDPSSGEPYILYGFEGIAYAADNGARVINCSWGGVGYSQFEQDVINYATSEGALVVAAAGNDGNQEFQTPAYYDNVLSVAATDAQDSKTYFTNYSYNVSVSAPGMSIWSTWGTNTYAELSGTSMATPCASGVAALVASKFPHYTPEQILEQVRVTSDNIDTINTNTGYVHMLGYGRVNAYRAVTVSSPAVKIDNIVCSDSVFGNNDGNFTDGETIQVFGTATDLLNPATNLQLTLTSSDPYVTVVNSNLTIGALQTLASKSLNSNPMSFKVADGVPAGHIATFLIEIRDGSYSDYKVFAVLLKPLFNQLKANDVLTTITAKGNIGFNDYPDNSQGIGFIYSPDVNNVLFEGAFMAGKSSSNVVDVARDSTGNEESNDFLPSALVTVQSPGPTADQEGVAVFSDSIALKNMMGIHVTLHTYAFERDSTSNFVILKYTIHNLNPTPINNFFGGLFLDWDVGTNGANNIAAYDRSYQLGYAYDTTRSQRTFAGCALLQGGSPNFTAIDNADPVNGIYQGFTKLHKWQAMSEGILDPKAGPSDVSMVVSAGPVVIPPNQDTALVFILAAGDTLQDLERAVVVAREIYGTPTQVVTPPPIPVIASLAQNFPNPFNPSTTIQANVFSKSRITLEVFNILGQKVRTIADQEVEAGIRNFIFNSESLPSGAYFVQLKAVSGTQTYIDRIKIAIIK